MFLKVFFAERGKSMLVYLTLFCLPLRIFLFRFLMLRCWFPCCLIAHELTAVQKLQFSSCARASYVFTLLLWHSSSPPRTKAYGSLDCHPTAGKPSDSETRLFLVPLWHFWMQRYDRWSQDMVVGCKHVFPRHRHKFALCISSHRVVMWGFWDR